MSVVKGLKNNWRYVYSFLETCIMARKKLYTSLRSMHAFVQGLVWFVMQTRNSTTLSYFST